MSNASEVSTKSLSWRRSRCGRMLISGVGDCYTVKGVPWGGFIAYYTPRVSPKAMLTCATAHREQLGRFDTTSDAKSACEGHAADRRERIA